MFVCWRKSDRKLTPSEEIKVKNYAILNFNSDDLAFPNGLCASCRIILSFQNRSGTLKVSVFHKVANFFEKDLRGQERCQCQIFEVSRINCLQALALKRKRGRPTLASQSPSEKRKNTFEYAISVRWNFIQDVSIQQPLA